MSMMESASTVGGLEAQQTVDLRPGQPVQYPGERVFDLRREQPHSIELTRNAKGEYGWQIKVYFESPDAAPTWSLKALDAWLRDNFLPKGASE